MHNLNRSSLKTNFDFESSIVSYRKLNCCDFINKLVTFATKIKKKNLRKNQSFNFNLIRIAEEKVALKRDGSTPKGFNEAFVF